MIPKCAIHWQVLVQAISRYRFKKEITRGRSSEHGGSLCPATAFPVLKLYYQRMEIQPGTGDGRSSTKLVLPENGNPAGRRPRPFQYQTCTTRERKSSRPPATAVPVPNWYYQRTKIQPAAGHGRSSTKLVLPRERKSSRPETAVPVLNLYYQRTKIQPDAGDARSSTKLVLSENENPAGRPRPFQYTKLVPENGNPARRRPRLFQY